MKKQVTFAESQTVQRLLHDETLTSNIQMNPSKMALKDVGTVRIPKAMTAAPFLQHTALTPAQKEYLYSIAASYSTAHVRSLITQHYMNVLHRCVRAGGAPDRDGLVVMSEASTENQSGKHELKTQKDIKPTTKQKGKVNTRHSGKSFLPTIPKRQTRPLKTSATKHKKTKSRQTSPQTQRKTSPMRAGTSLMDEDEEEDEEDEGLDDSLSDCLSSLSLGDWDDDSFSDL